MIVKSFEINKIKLTNQNLILFYGNNFGLKDQIKNSILKEKKITSIYDEKEVVDNISNFIENLSSKSLFEEEKIIIINRVSDKIYKIIHEIVEKGIDDLTIILDSENLEKKSKLRSFFEKSKECICIPVYPDNNETLAKLASQSLKSKNISISSSNLNLVINKCKGDRRVLFKELEKIENYSKNGKKINTESILKLTNLIENHSISELIDNCLANNKNKTINILIENNFNSEDCIIITRIFLTKLKRILKLCSEFQQNKDLDLTISMAKPPIFWKEKDITKKQILNWTPKKIRETLYKVNDIEFLIKKNYDNSVDLITDFILNLVSKKSNN
jgi:DNA polymerase-3 subunit delta